MLELLADALLLWWTVPIAWLAVALLIFKGADVHIEVTLWSGIDVPICAKFSKRSAYWCPVGLLGIEVELSEPHR
jgi:hypothetical protein